ncbi:MAG: hypothetical protein ACFFED_07205 [Candidatus Thorarchaeota archaeon]
MTKVVEMHSKKLHLIAIMGLAVLALGIVSGTQTLVRAQDDISFSLDRNFGTAFGNYVSGTFTLRGSAPDTVENITVFFNDEQVHFAEGNTITWQFMTSNYEAGSVNITLIGVDDTGYEYSTSRDFIFFSEGQTNLITIGVVVLVAIAIFAKYGPRFMNLRKKNPSQ